MFASAFILNSFQKMIPIAQTKADAIVMEKKSQLEVLYYLKMLKDYTGNPTFALKLGFEADDGGRYEIVIKLHGINMYR